MTYAQRAGVAELADAQDSKSCGGNFVWVQVPPPAFLKCKYMNQKVLNSFIAMDSGLFCLLVYTYHPFSGGKYRRLYHLSLIDVDWERGRTFEKLSG